MSLRRVRDDEGFSLLEVMFASFLAFFVLTASFGLLVASTKGTVSAGRQSMATALGNKLIEQARSLDYDAVSITTTGPLKANETTVQGGVEYTIQRSVTPIDDPFAGVTGAYDYKAVTIQVSWGSGNVLRFDTHIRNRGEDATPPSVIFVSGAVPAQNSIVFNLDGATQGSVWAGGTEPSATASAFALQGSGESISGLITRFEFWVDGRILQNPNLTGSAPYQSDRRYAAWLPNSLTFINDPAYPVDTKAVDASGTPLLPDGWRNFKVMVWASTGARDYKTLALFVDNDPPALSGTPATGDVSSNAGRAAYNFSASWTAPTDGTDGSGNPISVGSLGRSGYYDLKIQANNQGETVYSNVNIGNQTSYTFASGSPSGFTPSTFTAYRVAIKPRSARGLQGGWSPWTPYFITGPNLWATGFNDTGSKFDVTLNWTNELTASIKAALGANSVVYDLISTTTQPTSAYLTGTVTSNVSSPKSLTNVSSPTYYQIRATLKNSSGQVVGTAYSPILYATAANSGSVSLSPVP